MSLPIISTSIGAGKPKFKICDTMSAGRNAKEVPGNSRGRRSRSVSTSSSVSLTWPGLSEISTSASSGPIVPELL